MLKKLLVFGLVVGCGQVAWGKLIVVSLLVFSALGNPAGDCNDNGVPDIEEFDCDGDGVIDACEADSDNDGINDAVDACPCSLDVGVDENGRPLGDIDNDCDVDLKDYKLFMEGFTGIGSPSPGGFWDVFIGPDFDDYFGRFDFLSVVTIWWQDGNGHWHNTSGRYETDNRTVRWTADFIYQSPSSGCKGDYVGHFISNNVLKGTMTRRDEGNCSLGGVAFMAFRQ